jgi:aryl-alcohol dehydrogenase-like predicted oxidoreductase
MLDERGLAVLAALDAVAAAQEVPLASVALAWLYAQPTIGAPIASARTIDQLNELLPMATLTLTSAELDLLTKSSEL